MRDTEGNAGGRLKGWSRRKLDAKKQDQLDEETTVEPLPDVPEAPVDDPELIAALPSLDDITADFDMTPFLAKGVPAHLKNAALRKLWRASPAVRDYFDPAVDYAWDWNAPGGVPGGGGVLSEQSIAKMVKDLIGTRSEDTEDNDVVADDTAHLGNDVYPIEAAHQSEESEEADTAPAAVRHNTPPNPKQSKEETIDARRVAGHAALLPQRRHGGATPE